MKRLIIFLILVLPLSAFAKCKLGEREQFSEFFHRFAGQKTFSTERTIYPIYTLRHEYAIENNKEIRSVVKTSRSKIADASTPTLNEIAQKDGLKLAIQQQKETRTIVKMEKPDTDWLVTYHFVRRENCWFLHHIEDHSL